MLLIPATTERNPGCGYDCATRCKRHLLPISKQSPPAASLFFDSLFFLCLSFFLFFLANFVRYFFVGQTNCELRNATASANANGNEQQQWHLQLPPAVPAVSDDCGSSVCHTNQFMADQRLNNFCLALCNWRADNYAWQACSTALEPPKKKKEETLHNLNKATRSIKK